MPRCCVGAFAEQLRKIVQADFMTPHAVAELDRDRPVEQAIVGEGKFPAITDPKPSARLQAGSDRWIGTYSRVLPVLR